MTENKSLFSQVRKIDNSHTLMPLATTLLLFFIIWLFIWFFKGGSFRLYASVFFFLYSLTHQIWISVILIGVVQNLIFLPLRFISFRLSSSLTDFEGKMDQLKNDNDQYILFTKEVKSGNLALNFYIFNFLVNAVAFFSAGRIFLIDFYTKPLDPKYLLPWAPYPTYPLVGTDFYFPIFKVTSFITLPVVKIILFWLLLSLLFSIPYFFWRFLRRFLTYNQQILSFRISYNRLSLQLGSIGILLIILSFVFFRHVPTSFQSAWFVVDLTHRNLNMNFVTAVTTFFITFHAGYIAQTLAAKKAKKANIPPNIIKSVYKSNMKESFKNALILGTGAFLITNNIPSAFELSVATFEFLYLIYPYTFDRLINIKT